MLSIIPAGSPATARSLEEHLGAMDELYHRQGLLPNQYFLDLKSAIQEGRLLPTRPTGFLDLEVDFPSYYSPEDIYVLFYDGTILRGYCTLVRAPQIVADFLSEYLGWPATAFATRKTAIVSKGTLTLKEPAKLDGILSAPQELALVEGILVA